LQIAISTDKRRRQTLKNNVPNPKLIHGTRIAKVNQPSDLMKIQNIIVIVVCGLSMPAAAQNAGTNGVIGSPSQSTGNGPLIPGGQYNSNVVPGSGNQRRNIEQGLNNPGYYNPNYSTNFNGRSGHCQLTNGFGSRVITNGFGYGGITNGFGSGVISNGFGDGGITNGFGNYTNQGMIEEFGTNNENGRGYTNRHRPHLPPFTTDPRVMGSNDLNKANY
jgi:hypothetical protein